jgi:hypothetical protein
MKQGEYSFWPPLWDENISNKAVAAVLDWYFEECSKIAHI